jgi:hypothetical protein
MKILTGLLMSMLIIVVGAALIEPVNTSVAAITTPTYGGSVASISSLLPLFFVVMLILYIFKGFESF